MENKEKIVEKIEKYFKKFRFVKGVIIFGSFVKRSYFNDLDLALILSKRISYDKLLEMQVKVSDLTGIEADLKIFNELPLAFKFRILKEGKIVFAPKDFWKERWRIVKEYLDFKFLEDRYAKKVWGI